MGVKVKICGLTNLADAQAAVAAGADLLGFIFYSRSPRCVGPEQVRDILQALGPHLEGVLTVGVFVNRPAEDVAHLLDWCGLSLAQLHGEESPAALGLSGENPSPLRGRAYKAVRPRSADEATSLARRYALPSSLQAEGRLPALLVDAYHPDLRGGTGQTGDWQLAASLAGEYPLLLAGGLTPANVGQAVEQVRPWGVDVSGGVEQSPGVKDHTALHAFVAAAKSAGSEPVVEQACVADAGEILALQKLAYQVEARLHNDYTIQPLTQTLDQIQAEFEDQLFLKVMVGGRIIGSVRAHMDGETCFIGKLIVHPDFQNRGIGSKLLTDIEKRLRHARRYELFTGHKSQRNLSFYRKRGYAVFRRQKVSDALTLVFMQKYPGAE